MRTRGEGEGRLLAAAASAFASEGLEAANLDSIALQAHVSKSFIYSRFLGKSDLYGSLRRRLDDAYYRALLAIDLEGLSPPAAVRAYVAVLYGHHARYPVLTAMMRDQLRHGTAIFAPDDHVAGALAELRGRISAVLDRGRSDGAFRSDVNGDAFLFITVFLVMGALSDLGVTGSLLGRSALPAAEAAREEAIAALVLRALGAFGTVAADVVRPLAGPARPAAIDRQSRIGRILAAAEVCFGERGMDRTTLAEISNAAGVSLQLIYYYFSGKQELFEAVVEDVAVRTMPDLLGIGDAARRPSQTLERFLIDWWGIYAENPHRSFLAIDHSLHGKRMRYAPSVAARRNALVERLDALLAAGKIDGTIHRSIDAATLCFLGLALIPPAVVSLTSPAASSSRRLYFSLDLDPRSIIAFIIGAVSA